MLGGRCQPPRLAPAGHYSTSSYAWLNAPARMPTCSASSAALPMPLGSASSAAPSSSAGSPSSRPPSYQKARCRPHCFCSRLALLLSAWWHGAGKSKPRSSFASTEIPEAASVGGLFVCVRCHRPSACGVTFCSAATEFQCGSLTASQHSGQQWRGIAMAMFFAGVGCTILLSAPAKAVLVAQR